MEVSSGVWLFAEVTLQAQAYPPLMQPIPFLLTANAPLRHLQERSRQTDRMTRQTDRMTGQKENGRHLQEAAEIGMGTVSGKSWDFVGHCFTWTGPLFQCPAVTFLPEEMKHLRLGHREKCLNPSPSSLMDRDSQPEQRDWFSMSSLVMPPGWTGLSSWLWEF